MTKFQPSVAPKPLNGFRWNLEFYLVGMTTHAKPCREVVKRNMAWWRSLTLLTLVRVGGGVPSPDGGGGVGISTGGCGVRRRRPEKSTTLHLKLFCYTVRLCGLYKGISVLELGYRRRWRRRSREIWRSAWTNARVADENVEVMNAQMIELLEKCDTNVCLRKATRRIGPREDITLVQMPFARGWWLWLWICRRRRPL